MAQHVMADPADASSVAVGTTDVIRILIPQNASTGYVWRLAERGEGLELVGEQDVADGIVPGGVIAPGGGALPEGDGVPGGGVVPGAGGRHELLLYAVAPGVWPLRLVCQRPWEEVPIDERRVTVVVRGPDEADPPA